MAAMEGGRKGLKALTQPIAYVIILGSCGGLLWYYPSWKLLVGLGLIAFVFQCLVISRAKLAMTSGFPSVSLKRPVFLSLRRGHQLMYSPLPADIEVLWDGACHWHPAGAYKIRLVRLGKTWYAQRSPDGSFYSIDASTREPLNSPSWTTYHTYEAAAPTRYPPFTRGPGSSLKDGAEWVPTREALKAKVHTLGLVDSDDMWNLGTVKNLPTQRAINPKKGAVKSAKKSS